MISSQSDLKRAQFCVRVDEDGVELWKVQLGDVGYNYGKFGVELGFGFGSGVGIGVGIACSRSRMPLPRSASSE